MLSLEERTWIVERYIWMTCTELQEKFAEQFPQSTPPHRHTLRNLIRKFRKTGSVHDAPKSGRPLRLTPDKMNEIAEVVEKNPDMTLSELMDATNLTRSTVHRAKKKLNRVDSAKNNSKSKLQSKSRRKGVTAASDEPLELVLSRATYSNFRASRSANSQQKKLAKPEPPVNSNSITRMNNVILIDTTHLQVVQTDLVESVPPESLLLEDNL